MKNNSYKGYHSYDASCYCDDCCAHEEMIQHRARKDRDRERNVARRMRRFGVEDLTLELEAEKVG